MSISSMVKAGLLCISAFFISSCSSPSQKWVTRESPNSKKISLPVENKFREIELEILECASGTHMYANLHSIPLKSTTGKVILKVTIDGEAFDVETDLMQGGQRLLIPVSAAQKISCALQNHQAVSLSIGRYSRALPPF